MNPFDLEKAVLARHAQHVVLVHFPIALFLVGVALDLARRRARGTALADAAYVNVIAAAISTIPVLATGLLAWKLQLGGHRPRGNLLLHLVLGCVASAMIWLAGWLHVRSRRNPSGSSAAFRVAVELLAAGVVVVTAHVGGFLSGVNVSG